MTAPVHGIRAENGAEVVPVPTRPPRSNEWLRPHTHPLRAYVTLAGETAATIIDATGWPALADYLRSDEIAAMAGRVLAVTIVDRSPARHFDPVCGCPAYPLPGDMRWVDHCGGCSLPQEPEPDWDMLAAGRARGRSRFTGGPHAGRRPV